MSGVFKFMTLRGTQPSLSPQMFPRVDVEISEAFHRKLLEARQASLPVQAMSSVAADHVGGEEFAVDADRTGMPLSAFCERACGPEGATLERLKQLVRELFQSSPTELVSHASFKQTRIRLSDSLVAAAIMGSADIADVESLASGLRGLSLIAEVAAESPRLRTDHVARWAFVASIQLPADLFPLPEDPDPNAHKLVEIAASERRREQEAAAERHRTAQRRAELRTAYHEVRDLPADGFVLRQANDERERPPEDLEEGIGNPTPPPQRWELTPAATARLSPQTQRLLAEHGIGELTLDNWPSAVNTMLNASASMHGSAAYTSPFSSYLGMGHVLVEADDLLADRQAPVEALAPRRAFRAVGWGDLEVLREDIQQYELGEISHVENVLKGESKARRHLRRRRIEEATVLETERIE